MRQFGCLREIYKGNDCIILHSKGLNLQNFAID